MEGSSEDRRGHSREVVQDEKARKRETVTVTLGTGTDLFSRDRGESRERPGRPPTTYLGNALPAEPKPRVLWGRGRAGESKDIRATC